MVKWQMQDVNDKEAKNINKAMNSIQTLIDRYKQ